MIKKIAIDLMGSDNAPYPEIEAIKKFLYKYREKNIEIYGFITKEKLNNVKKIAPNINYIVCEDYIKQNDEALIAYRNKQNSTLIKALTYAKDKKVDSVISCANTGAYVTAALFTLGRINNIKKPALFTILNGLNNKIVFGDLGAIVDCNLDNLTQNALLGIFLSKSLNNKNSPKIGLVNIGEEKHKGNKLYREAYNKLNENKYINFFGNIEPSKILTTDLDVIITDGFTGNNILKSYEGSMDFLAKFIKKKIKGFYLIPTMFLAPKIKEIKKELTQETSASAILMGVNSIVIKSHGNSSYNQIISSIEMSYKLIEEKLIEKLKYFKDWAI